MWREGRFRWRKERNRQFFLPAISTEVWFERVKLQFMTRTLDFSPELETQLERATALLQTDAVTFILQAVREKTARVFDEARFETLLSTDAVAAMNYLLETTPNRRIEAGFGLSPSDDVALAYEDDLA